jgi:hypothetical protein
MLISRQWANVNDPALQQPIGHRSENGIGAQDSNVSFAPILAFSIPTLIGHECSVFQSTSEDWHSGFQECGNEPPLSLEVLTGF